VYSYKFIFYFLSIFLFLMHLFFCSAHS